MPNEILEFWFSPRVSKLWFNSTPEFDKELKDRFEPLLRRAIAGELSDWKNSAAGALALAIVLDQFPLNMFRGKAESYATGHLAVAVAKDAIAHGFDSTLPKSQLAFLYMPLLHSESMADQNQSVELFEKAELKGNIAFAKHHREIVRRFGRFPHRNQALGRVSTPEETAYLASKEGFQG
ncbi:MAG: DUF924 family protein [Bacteriovoracia bacterium]